MRLAILMLTCAFALTLSTAIFKLFAIQDEFWATMAWTSVGQMVLGYLLISRVSVRCQLGAKLHHDTGTVLAVNAANEAITLGGSLAQHYAPPVQGVWNEREQPTNRATSSSTSDRRMRV